VQASKRNSVRNPWIDLTFKTMAMGVEAQSVIAMRLLRLAAGGARGQTEARLMMAEKVTALAEAQSAAAASLLTGGKHHVAAGKALNAVRKRVRANRRRLSRR
jgi:hypothetical protein